LGGSFQVFIPPGWVRSGVVASGCLYGGVQRGFWEGKDGEKDELLRRSVEVHGDGDDVLALREGLQR